LPGPFPHWQRLALLLVLLAAHILLAGLGLLRARRARLASLLALLLAGLLTRLGLVLALLLLTRLSRLVALTALVVGHSRKSSWMGFSSPKVEPSRRQLRSVKYVQFQRFLVMRQETKHARFHGAPRAN
jgi:hypothetical protein